ncbi:MAG: isochorismate synthase [Acidobacteria bacterium]|nr:isochorismate synthase [Acidobacteriota bacterium]
MSATEAARGSATLLALLREAARARPDAIAVASVPAPPAPLESLLRAAPRETAVLWHPPAGDALSGIGETARVALSGAARFEDLHEAGARLAGRLHARGGGAAGALPALVGGLAFAPGTAAATPWAGFGDGLFVLPRWTYRRRGDAGLLTLAVEASQVEALAAAIAREHRAIAGVLAAPPPAARAPRAPAALRSTAEDDWRRLVEDARSAIARGAMEKVVLARRTIVEMPAPIDAADLLSRLEEQHGEQFRFAVRAGGRTFLGASPELLVALRGNDVSCDALAGSAVRAPDGATDAELGRQLLANPKERLEHDLVVRAIRERLAPWCARLEIPPAPSVRVLRRLLHLSTPVRGELRAPRALPALARLLHPTPAVGGHPTAPAVAWIQEHEPDPRGWYAGPVGRIGADGDGEFAVAIRSALVDGATAHVYAGAGILPGSEPHAEFEETRVKGLGVLTALGLYGGEAGRR